MKSLENTTDTSEDLLWLAKHLQRGNENAAGTNSSFAPRHFQLTSYANDPINA